MRGLERRVVWVRQRTEPPEPVPTLWCTQMHELRWNRSQRSLLVGITSETRKVPSTFFKQVKESWVALRTRSGEGQEVETQSCLLCPSLGMGWAISQQSPGTSGVDLSSVSWWVFWHAAVPEPEGEWADSTGLQCYHSQVSPFLCEREQLCLPCGGFLCPSPWPFPLFPLFSLTSWLWLKLDTWQDKRCRMSPRKNRPFFFFFKYRREMLFLCYKAALPSHRTLPDSLLSVTHISAKLLPHPAGLD